jgi:hypothetical protein
MFLFFAKDLYFLIPLALFAFGQKKIQKKIQFLGETKKRKTKSPFLFFFLKNAQFLFLFEKK